MQINTVDFVKSSKNTKEAPIGDFIEYAFIGRSNVGKSSLINSLVSRRNIANISSKPGRTKLINHYLVNNSWFFTDFPGYGYAKSSKSNRKEFQKLIIDYLLNRKQLTNLFVLIDARHFPMKIDLKFIEFVGENQIPFSIAFTKYDKIKLDVFQEVLFRYKQKILEIFNELPPIFITSSKTKFGCKEIINYINTTSVVKNATN